MHLLLFAALLGGTLCPQYSYAATLDEECCKRIETVMKANSDSLLKSEGKDIVVFLGNTGAGKSTLIDYLADIPLKSDERGRLVLQNSEDVRAMKIGAGNSVTRYPKSIQIGSQFFFDLPGFEDTGDLEQKIVNSVFIKHILDKAKSLKFVFVSNESEFIASRGDSFKKLLEKVSKLYGDTQMSRSVLDSHSIFVVTASTQFQDEEVYLFEEQCPGMKVDVTRWTSCRKFFHIPKPDRNLTNIEKKELMPIFSALDQVSACERRPLINGEAIQGLDVKVHLRNIFSHVMGESFKTKRGEIIKGTPHTDITGLGALIVKYHGLLNDVVVPAIEGLEVIKLLKQHGESVYKECLDILREEKATLVGAEIEELKTKKWQLIQAAVQKIMNESRDQHVAKEKEKLGFGVSVDSLSKAQVSQHIVSLVCNEGVFKDAVQTAIGGKINSVSSIAEDQAQIQSLCRSFVGDDKENGVLAFKELLENRKSTLQQRFGRLEEEEKKEGANRLAEQRRLEAEAANRLAEQRRLETEGAKRLAEQRRLENEQLAEQKRQNDMREAEQKRQNERRELVQNLRALRNVVNAGGTIPGSGSLREAFNAIGAPLRDNPNGGDRIYNREEVMRLVDNRLMEMGEFRLSHQAVGCQHQ